MVKTPEEIEKIRISCKKCREVLAGLGEFLKEGISTYEVDEKAAASLKLAGVVAAFKNYNGYPAHICISVNEEVVHGIPSKEKILKDGDVVSIDIGAIYKGFYSDYAATFPIGKISALHMRLIEVARESFMEGFAKALPGMRTGDIGAAVQKYAEANKFSVVREFVGHGVGKDLHELPEVPNFGVPGKGVLLHENEVIAIEPMVNAGRPDVKILEDGWKVVTADGGYSAHYEECVLITKKGPELLAC
ncbi:MAG TPA: type I methionyl aminopeptidase [bacterium]|nr:type I methionyl aminopeptidase [bacterium]